MVLAPFSDRVHAYAQKALEKTRHVKLELGVKVTEVKADRVVLSDGREILTRAVVWAGGIQAAGLGVSAGIEQGPGGRIDVGADLTVTAFPGVYALGDVANTPGPDGKPFPQLGSVALQAGRCAAENILADIDGKSPVRLPLPRQGDHGDDRPQRRRRRGRAEATRAARGRSRTRRGSACTPGC